jgi:hypothetical protein
MALSVAPAPLNLELEIHNLHWQWGGPHLAAHRLPLEAAVGLRNHHAIVAAVPPAVELASAAHGARVRGGGAHRDVVCVLREPLRAEPRPALPHPVVAPTNHFPHAARRWGRTAPAGAIL